VWVTGPSGSHVAATDTSGWTTRPCTRTGHAPAREHLQRRLVDCRPCIRTAVSRWRGDNGGSSSSAFAMKGPVDSRATASHVEQTFSHPRPPGLPEASGGITGVRNSWRSRANASPLSNRHRNAPAFASRLSTPPGASWPRSLSAYLRRWTGSRFDRPRAVLASLRRLSLAESTAPPPTLQSPTRRSGGGGQAPRLSATATVLTYDAETAPDSAELASLAYRIDRFTADAPLLNNFCRP